MRLPAAKSYRAKWREPIIGQYKNYRIIRTGEGLALENCSLGEGEIDIVAIARAVEAAGADGISADRLAPTAHAVAGLGAPLAVILPEAVDLGVEAAAVWTYPSGVSELLSPIITAVPLELLAHSLATTLDRHPFDYGNPARRLISEKTIYRDGESAQAISRRYQPGTQ